MILSRPAGRMIHHHSNDGRTESLSELQSNPSLNNDDDIIVDAYPDGDDDDFDDFGNHSHGGNDGNDGNADDDDGNDDIYFDDGHHGTAGVGRRTGRSARTRDHHPWMIPFSSSSVKDKGIITRTTVAENNNDDNDENNNDDDDDDDDEGREEHDFLPPDFGAPLGASVPAWLVSSTHPSHPSIIFSFFLF